MNLELAPDVDLQGPKWFDLFIKHIVFWNIYSYLVSHGFTMQELQIILLKAHFLHHKWSCPEMIWPNRKILMNVAWV